MKFPIIDHIICFGGSHLLLAVVKLCQQRGMRSDVYTAPRQADEILDESGLTLAEALRQLNQPFVVTDDINAEAALSGQIGSGTLGLGLGEAWSFAGELIKNFDNRLIDFMGIPHPRYRGGAHYTWMIMRNDRDMGCNLQIINEEMVQGVFDSGSIIYSHAYAIPEQCRRPIDYFRAAVDHEIEFMGDFLDKVSIGHDFILQAIDESKSLYLPRLRTIDQGWIDWSWSGLDIRRFIDAFDDPYPGAGTYINGEHLVRCKHAELLTDEACFHPFQSGLITRVEGDFAVVATTAGHLRLRLIGDAPIRLGDRLLTPHATLEKARCMHAEYGVK